MSRAIKMIVISIALGSLLAWAGSQNSIEWQGLPLFAVCVGLAFVIQWLVFVPSYLKQTEHFYDLTGSLTYLSLMGFVVLVSEQLDHRSLILAAMVTIWAARLGAFLFARISKDGSDNRFDKIKPDAVRFLAAWTVQGLWVCFTASAALAAILSEQKIALSWLAALGCLLWIVGFLLEVVADYQKRMFRARKEETGHRFIHTGLWAYSRHPNYFGEIVLWVGVSVVAFPVLSTWGYLTLLSPIFVIFLLTRVSGIPALEKNADRRFAGDPLYEAYKEHTPVLVPRLSRPVYLQESQS